jgi:uncharacterized OsmC-like protein
LIKFTESATEKTKREMRYKKEHELELAPFHVTVLLEKKDDFLSSATRAGREFVWYSDEPKEEGGSGIGAGPLSYFLSSMGFCQFVHYTEHSMVDGIQLESLRMKIEAKVTEQRPRRFEEIKYEVTISSRDSDDTIRNLARRAAEDCYVTNTIKRSCPVTGIIIHNGHTIDEHD